MQTSEPQQAKDAAHIGRTLMVAQALFTSGYFGAATIGALVGAALAGDPALAGVPTSVTLVGSAVSAPLWGVALDRIGRRGGLSLGLLVGTVGAGIGAYGIATGSLLIFLLGALAIGSARGAMDLGRYVAGEVQPPARRARAISRVVVASTVGAVLGPLLVGPTGRAAANAGLPELSGPYLLAVPLLLATAVGLALFLRPEPRQIALAIDEQHPQLGRPSGMRRPWREILAARGVLTASWVMVTGQVVMVLLMVITALHMQEHDHSLSNVSLVISSHTFGMFAFSVVSGWLTDRLGRGPTILMGLVGLAAACLVSGLSTELVPLSLSLFLLGLGWNFCYVAGSTLLADQLGASERARVQGLNDALIGSTSALASLGSGFVFAGIGYQTMGWLGAALCLPPALAVIGWRNRLAPDQTGAPGEA
jgi:MFS family permease